MAKSDPFAAPNQVHMSPLPPTFFTDYFRSVSDVLDARFKGMQWKGQNSADRGELCETFVKDLLVPFFDGILRVHRGGKIVSVGGLESAQIDVLLTGQSTLKFFADKGIYPVETVFGAFAVTSSLDLPKLRDSVANLASIPNHAPYLDRGNQQTEEEKQVFTTFWRDNCPFRCVFGFGGDIAEKWTKELVELEASKKIRHEDMPHLIVVNKKGHIVRGDGPVKMMSGNFAKAPYYYVDYALAKDHFWWVSALLKQQFEVSRLQRYFLPDYCPYFNSDADTGWWTGFLATQMEKLTGHPVDMNDLKNRAPTRRDK